MGRRVTGHPQDHLAARRELNGVAEQIQDDLAQMDRVSFDYLGDAGNHVANDLKALLISTEGNQTEGVFETFAEMEVDGFEVELAGFDLREIENIVDDGEQGLGRVLITPRYSYCSGLRSVARASSVIPTIPFMGVRISWLILARNSLLTRLASSAACFALTSSVSARSRSAISLRRALVRSSTRSDSDS
jgi:hypothetical protein